ncbi:MAG: type II secretion system protein J [Burkholderiales bacterium]
MKNRKGFTLIEMIIVVALVGAVSLLMYSFFGQGFNLYVAESKSADEQTSLRQVLSDITNKSRLTKADQVTADAGLLTIGAYVYRLYGEKITRNGTVIASGIASFSASKTDGLLEIGLKSVSGKSISTSVSLLG